MTLDGDQDAQADDDNDFEDQGLLDQDGRDGLIAVLKRHFVSGEDDPATWKKVSENRDDIESRLNELSFDLVINDEYTVAYKALSENRGGYKSTLATNREYSRFTTVVLLILRQELREKDDDGMPVFIVHRDLVDRAIEYVAEEDSDRSRRRADAARAVEEVRKLKILIPDRREGESDEDMQYRISSALSVLMGLEQLDALHSTLVEANGGHDNAEH